MSDSTPRRRWPAAIAVSCLFGLAAVAIGVFVHWLFDTPTWVAAVIIAAVSGCGAPLTMRMAGLIGPGSWRGDEEAQG